MSSTALQHKKQGLREYGEGKYVEAVSSFEKAIVLGERSLMTYDCKAAALSRSSNSIETALRVAERMTDIFKKDKYLFKAYYRKADILRTRQSYTDALKAIRESEALLSRLPVSDRPKHLATVRLLADRIAREGKEYARKELRAKRITEQELEARRRAQIRDTTDHTHLLPRDVVISVCEYAMAGGGDDWAAFKMARVCRGWRQVVLSQRSLWGTLVLGGKKGERSVKKAEYWMDRSGGNIKRLVFDKDFDRARELQVAQRIQAAIGGVRELEINCHLGLMAHWKNMFKNLESLIRRVCGQNSVYQEIDLGLCHPTSRSLRRLELNGHIFNLFPDDDNSQPMLVDEDEEDDPPPIAPHLAQVEIVKLTSCLFTLKIPTRTEILKLFPAAKEVILHDVIRTGSILNHGASTADSLDVDMELLVRYSENGSTEPRAIFDAGFAAPNLRELDLWGLTGDIVRFQLNGAGLAEALPNMTSLDIGKTTLDQQEFIAFLPQLPSLEFLNVSYCSLTDAFLQAISHRDGLDREDQLLPSLTALSIAGTAEISTAVVRDFVDSRLPRDERFRTRKPRVEVKKTSAFRPSVPKQPDVKAEPRTGESSMKKRKSGLEGLFAPGMLSARPRKTVSGSRTNALASHTTSPALPSASSSKNSQILVEATPVTAASLPSATPVDEFGITPSFFATQRSPLPRPRMTWLNLDSCEKLDLDLLPLLETKVRYVSLWHGTAVPDRIRGRGKWKWDQHVERCVRDGDQQCQVVRIPGMRDGHRVHHVCARSGFGERDATDTEDEAVKEKGWWRNEKSLESGSSSLSIR